MQIFVLVNSDNLWLVEMGCRYDVKISIKILSTVNKEFFLIKYGIMYSTTIPLVLSFVTIGLNLLLGVPILIYYTSVFYKYQEIDAIRKRFPQITLYIDLCLLHGVNPTNISNGTIFFFFFLCVVKMIYVCVGWQKVTCTYRYCVSLGLISGDLASHYLMGLHLLGSVAIFLWRSVNIYYCLQWNEKYADQSWLLLLTVDYDKAIMIERDLAMTTNSNSGLNNSQNNGIEMQRPRHNTEVWRDYNIEQDTIRYIKNQSCFIKYDKSLGNWKCNGVLCLLLFLLCAAAYMFRLEKKKKKKKKALR
ncbi:hypothetical protein RFI_23560 [Reticulomyxa filosa]|uniref:Uncharacterized protein n=1 Tax=Reticulomyxa filosa TaxID=46433 RepID=X6MIH5_RETFI|nr:hypothetical protein RFI_23560 [Reticulomyxa filosa]|eukprot:ETO13808.1 hypothetical protein RFI_23560 [Reticulomyxa filosa]